MPEHRTYLAQSSELTECDESDRKAVTVSQNIVNCVTSAQEARVCTSLDDLRVDVETW